MMKVEILPPAGSTSSKSGNHFPSQEQRNTTPALYVRADAHEALEALNEEKNDDCNLRVLIQN